MHDVEFAELEQRLTMRMQELQFDLQFAYQLDRAWLIRVMMSGAIRLLWRARRRARRRAKDSANAHPG